MEECQQNILLLSVNPAPQPCTTRDDVDHIEVCCDLDRVAGVSYNSFSLTL